MNKPFVKRINMKDIKRLQKLRKSAIRSLDGFKERLYLSSNGSQEYAEYAAELVEFGNALLSTAEVSLRRNRKKKEINHEN